jgi:heme oxygenase
MNTTLSPVSFLERLRTATSQSHTNLEALPVSVSIMNPNVTNHEYAHYLSLMQDVVKDAEENIFPVLENIIPDLQNRLKSHFIANDLTALGHLKKEPGALPLSKGAANISAGFALGIMYVVEGSSLGGRVILKNIHAALGHDEKNGAQYFAGYGATTGSSWKSFLAMLMQYEEENNCSEEIIAGADYAFKAISDHFMKNVSQ